MITEGCAELTRCDREVGVLHLAGHDHVRVRDANIMEPLEVKILAGLGIADPYKKRARPQGKARATDKAQK